MKGKRPAAFRKPGKSKPPGKDSMEAEVPRKLSEVEINERSRRLARKQVELQGLEKRKRLDSAEISKDIKILRAEVETLAQQIVDGEELLPQGDLFVDGSTKVPSPGQAIQGVVDVAKHAGVPPPADGKGKEAPAP